MRTLLLVALVVATTGCAVVTGDGSAACIDLRADVQRAADTDTPRRIRWPRVEPQEAP